MSSLIKTNASGELGVQVLPLPLTQSTTQSTPRKNRWPARLDVLQSATGFALAVFLMAHMFFVSTILISHQAFYSVARFFEGAYFLGKPYPILVSGVVAVILALFIGHAALAMRKFPAGYRQFSAFRLHKNRFQHGDTSLWWIQVLTGFALFFMTTVHLYDMLTQPALIGPFESADRVWTGNMWPLYLGLLFAVELHGGIGLYRLAIKWGWLEGHNPRQSRRRLAIVRHSISAFFITLGLVTLLAYVDLGRAHADHAGERYTPPQSLSSIDRH
ncbi:MAG: Fumarate reductase respiratory complex, transrane subunit [Proteobacteria bacterium]|nr:Fumarate reductase respiratory complex, transrane subunit [Pseudomonadota bacterium]